MPAPIMDSALREMLTRNLARFEPRLHPIEDRKHAAVALAVIADEFGAPAVIITKRTPRLSSHAGQWALPGGRLDPGETVEQAALRELQEEVGLALQPESILGRLDDYPTRSGYVITPVVMWAEGVVELTPNDAEVHIVHRVSFAELDRPGSPEFVRIPESDRPVVRLLIYEHKIHAPTAAIVYQFREAVVKGNPIRVDHLEQPVFAWR